MELPALTGSEKQIAWANDIRAKVFAEWDARVAEFGAPDPSIPAQAKVIAAYEQLLAESSAKWWIDCGKLGMNLAIKHKVAGN